MGLSFRLKTGACAFLKTDSAPFFHIQSKMFLVPSGQFLGIVRFEKIPPMPMTRSIEKLIRFYRA